MGSADPLQDEPRQGADKPAGDRNGQGAKQGQGEDFEGAEPVLGIDFGRRQEGEKGQGQGRGEDHRAAQGDIARTGAGPEVAKGGFEGLARHVEGRRAGHPDARFSLGLTEGLFHHANAMVAQRVHNARPPMRSLFDHKSVMLQCEGNNQALSCSRTKINKFGGSSRNQAPWA